MKKTVATILICTMTFPVISHAATMPPNKKEISSEYFQDLNDDTLATSSTAKPIIDDVILDEDEIILSSEVELATPSQTDKTITDILLNVKYKQPLNEENISIELSDEQCTVSKISFTSYNEATVRLSLNDGYTMPSDLSGLVRLDSESKGVKVSNVRKYSKYIAFNLLFDISAEIHPDDDLDSEFRKAVGRFKYVANEIGKIGVKMNQANTREDVYSLLVSRFKNAATENIEFQINMNGYGDGNTENFIPAVAGTKNNESGSNGFVSILVELWPKNHKEDRESLHESFTIYATRYNDAETIDDGHEKNRSYENIKEDSISFYKNGKILTLPCKIYYDNQRKGRYTTVQYNSIKMEEFNGKSPNLIIDYNVLKNGGYSSTYTTVFVHVNGKRTDVVGGNGGGVRIHFHENQKAITIPYYSFNEGDNIELYVDGFPTKTNNSSNGSSGGSSGSSSGGSGGGGGGGSSSGGRGIAPSGMLITKPTINAGTWELIEGKWKLKLPDDSFASLQWAFLENKWYLIDGNEIMLTGWQKVNGKWYLLGQDGAMLTGWNLVDGKWYWMELTGEMATGWKLINEKWYYLDESGAMLSNGVTPDGYQVDENGQWI